MRTYLLLLAVVGCHGVPHIDADAGSDANTAPPHASVQGICTQMIASDGGMIFPSTSTAQSSDRQVELVNDGSAMIYDAGFSIDGADAADFVLRSNGNPDLGNGTDCTASMFEGFYLPPGDACELHVTFHPSAPGDKHAVLHATLPGNAGTLDLDIPLHATAVGAAATLTISTPDIAFARASPSDGTFSIANNGTSTVALGDAVVAPLPFTFESWDCPPSLTPGGACTSNVGFDWNHVKAGCPAGTFSTTTGAISLPLSALVAPASILTVSTAINLGAVHVEPGNHDCPQPSNMGPEQPCTFTFKPTDQVVVTAVPNPGVQFLGWSEDDPSAGCGTSLSCSLPLGFYMRSVGAMFLDPSLKTIAVTIVGTGTVTGPDTSCTSSCTMYASSGESVMLTESTAGTFVGWSGDCAGTDSCQLGTVINNRSVTATFDP